MSQLPGGGEPEAASRRLRAGGGEDVAVGLNAAAAAGRSSSMRTRGAGEQPAGRRAARVSLDEFNLDVYLNTFHAAVEPETPPATTGGPAEPGGGQRFAARVSGGTRWRSRPSAADRAGPAVRAAAGAGRRAAGRPGRG